MRAIDLLLIAPESQLLRMRRAVMHICRSNWLEAAALLVLVARDTPNTPFSAACAALAQEITQ